MNPQPSTQADLYRPAGKLNGKVAMITGGDSGIGRAVAVAFAKEGATVAFVYLSEHEDAQETRFLVEQEHQQCYSISGDVGNEAVCHDVIGRVVREYGRLDILVNNAAEQHVTESIAEISSGQLEHTFRTNIFSYFYMTKASLPHLKKGSSIINTTSVTAYQGQPQLLDYSSTKGAIVTFTRSLALQLAPRDIRVNGVAPGPVWTPLIPASFPSEHVESFGANTPLGRPGQPDEIAPCYVFLASSDSSYMTGQILHPNGGRIVNG